MSIPKRTGDPVWKVTFVKKANLPAQSFRAPTEGHAVRRLLKQGINVRLIEKLVQIGVWVIIFLCTLKRS